MHVQLNVLFSLPLVVTSCKLPEYIFDPTSTAAYVTTKLRGKERPKTGAVPKYLFLHLYTQTPYTYKS